MSRLTSHRRRIGAVVALVLATAGLAIAAPASATPVPLTINGTVVDYTGAPVEAQTVYIYAGYNSYSVVTDVAGQFSVAVEYDTDATWISIGTGAASTYIDSTTLGGATSTSITLTLPHIITVTVDGYVTDAYGAPLPGTEVRAWPSSGGLDSTTNAAADGYYSLTLFAEAGGSIEILAQDYHYWTSISGYMEGEVVHHDFTIGHGSISSIQIDGLLLDANGSPVPFRDVTIATDVTYYSATTDESGHFSQTVEYGEFGWLNLWADHAGLVVDLTTLIGQASTSIVLQQLPPAHVTVSGYVTDLDGAFLAHQLVQLSAENSVYGWSDASGYYSLTVLADPFASISVLVEGGDETLQIGGAPDGTHLTQDLVVSGSGYEIGVAGVHTTCDIDGDGFADDIRSYHMITANRSDWQFVLGENGMGWAAASFGTGDIDAVYCADLNGDGAPELIAHSQTVKNKPGKDDPKVTHTWWVYEYATGTVTEQVFGKGTITGVYFENLDDQPGVELIATRTADGEKGKWWILDDAASVPETITLGFKQGGVVSFEDVDGAAGTDIVVSREKKNGKTKIEYYTRASGVGQIVKSTINAV